MYINKIGFNFKSRVVFENSKVPLTTSQKDYIDNFEEGYVNDYYMLGEGVTSNAYYSKTQDFVIKQNKYNPYVPSKSRTDMGSLYHESKMLLSINPNVKTTQRGIAYVETAKGGEFLLSSFVEGKPADKEANPFTEKHIDRLLRNLCRLDRSMIIHSDLSKPNLLLNDNGDVNIIDYQWAEIYDPRYKYDNFELRNSFFPSFECPNNASMFESACLAGYCRSLPPDEAKVFLKKYYANKAHYNEKNVKKLKEYQEQHRYFDLSDIIKFEEARVKAYSSMDDYILEAENMKMNILNLHRRQYSSYDVNKTHSRNILRAIPLCIRAKEYADALANYDRGHSVDATYFAYMREFGKFWQNNIKMWYSDTLKWIYDLMANFSSDPAKTVFPEKFNDFSDVGPVKIYDFENVPRKYAAEDLRLREICKTVHNEGFPLNSMYRGEVSKIVEKIFEIR